jgi:lactoylglutathione lyase
MAQTTRHGDGAAREIARLRFELFVCDLQRSISFYERVLDFKVEHSSRAPSSDYVKLTNGVVQIGLGARDALADDHYFRTARGDRPGVGVEIVFEVESIAVYEQRARLANAVFEPMRERPWGRRDFRVVDPDGYYIRVTESDRQTRF